MNEKILWLITILIGAIANHQYALAKERMWTMYERDGMSATEYLAHRVRSGRLEPDYEQTPWAVWTAECGFFSAACLQRLFLRESLTRNRSGRSARRSPDHDWGAVRGKTLQLIMVRRCVALGVPTWTEAS